MWFTTFAFQPWHSAVEFKRYLLRFMMEFTRIESLAGVKRTIYNQYDSLVLPLQKWLKDQGVQLITDCKVTNITNQSGDVEFIATGILCLRAGTSEVITVNDGDMVFLQNGSMTSAPKRLTKVDSGGWKLWEKLAKGRPHFGNPAAFNSCIAQSNWESFTVTLIRLRSGKLVIHSTAPFTPEDVAAIRALGEPGWLLDGILRHDTFANEGREAFPGIP